MVYNCVCAGCNNSSKTGHRVHAFPKDKATLRQWVQFVRVRRADFSIPSVTKNSKVCSAHFTEEDYDQGDVRMVFLGLKSLAQLIPNAVPSVHTHLSACPAPRPRGTKISAASRKRELAMMLTDASPCETTDSVNAATVEDPLPYSTCDTGTQCILKPLGRSHAVQVNLKPKMVSVGTQTSFSPQTSTPLASPEQTVDDDDDNATVISDLSWVPEEPMDEEELFDEEPPYTCDPHHKFPKNGERRRKWEVVLRRDGFAATDRALLCSEHFTSEDFDRTGHTVRLKDGVVPTIFNFPAHLQRSEATRSTATSRRAEDNLLNPMDLISVDLMPDVIYRVQPMHPRVMPPFLRLQLSSPVNRSHGARQSASSPVFCHPGSSGVYYATNPAMDPARKQSLRFTETVKQEEKDTRAEKDIQYLPSDKTHAVMIKQERDTEASVGSNYGGKKEEQQEQPIATEIKVEPSDEEERFPYDHLKQEGFAYPPLPAMPFPSVLNIEAASFNIPPRLSIHLLLVCKPPGLSVLWNVEETDPSPPPMESYSVYMAVEKDKESGVFVEWKTLGLLKATPLPMCMAISQVKPGFRACFAVVGKDMYGRYGPFSKIMPVIMPDHS